MENDYILRKDAIAALISVETVMPQFGGGMVERAGAVKAIRSIPAAEVAPVRKGHWIPVDPDGRGYTSTFECANCHCNNELAYFTTADLDNDFCPRCGAKMMDGEQDE